MCNIKQPEALYQIRNCFTINGTVSIRKKQKIHCIKSLYKMEHDRKLSFNKSAF